MRKTVLFIAISLDGYIADQDGAVDWLNGENTDTENIDTYSEFVKTIDTVIMGWNTYHQVVTKLSPAEWVYNDFTTYVITHRNHTSSEKIRFTSTNPVDLIKSLKKEKGKGRDLQKEQRETKCSVYTEKKESRGKRGSG